MAVPPSNNQQAAIAHASFRWEIVAAAVCFVVFWADVSTLRFVRGLPPGDRYYRLAQAVPWFVLTPAFAISTLRNSRANRAPRLVAGAILVLYFMSAEFWYVAGYIARAVSLLSG